MTRLHVCHVITMLELGGAQRNTLHTVRHLDRNGFRASLIAGPGGLLDDEARALDDVAFETCPDLVREVRPLTDLRALVDLRRRLARLAPDIVHTHSSKAGILGRAAAFLAGVPVIVHTVHGWGFHPGQGAPVRAAYVLLEQAAANLTTRLVTVSRANARTGAEQGIAPEAAFTLIHSGIETRRFAGAVPDGAVRRELGIARDAPLVAMIACLKPQKAPLDFVRVAARVLGGGAPAAGSAHFVLAGDGELRRDVEAEIERSGLGARVHLLGWRDDPERILADADLLLLTSRHEGLPRVVPEAMAAGVPVVATAVDGTPEAVEAGVTGLLREPGDVEGLAADVAELLRNGERRAAMGAAARERVAPWDIDEMVRAQETLYSRLAAQAGLAARGLPRHPRPASA